MMQPGRELDALVAENVMGRAPESFPPHYSTDIAAAWVVFMHFEDVYKSIAHTRRRSLGWTLGQPMEWQCTIYATNTQTADTAPHAICLAALAALKVQP